MSALLDQLLHARKLKSKEELTKVEMLQYEKWEKVLTSDLTAEDVANNIKTERDRLQDEWLAEDSKSPFNYLFHWKREVEIKARIRNYNTIIRLISNHESKKENLIKYIKNLINNKS